MVARSEAADRSLGTTYLVGYAYQPSLISYPEWDPSSSFGFNH